MKIILPSCFTQIILISFFILCGIFIGSWIIFNKKYNTVQQSNEYLNSRIQSINIKSEDYNHAFYHNFIENRKIIDTFTCFETENKTKACITEKINTKPHLVFRFNSGACRECIDRIIDDLLIQIESKYYNQVIILTSFETNMEAVVLNSRLPKDIQVCNVPVKTLNLLLENTSLPYYFVINRSLEITHLYVPGKGIFDRSTQYFSIINKTFKDGTLAKK